MNVVLRGKFVEQSASFKNKKWRDIILTSLTAHLKDLQQTENLTPRRSRQQELINSEMKSIKQKKKQTKIQRINETNSLFFKKILKIYKFLVKLINSMTEKNPN